MADSISSGDPDVDAAFGGPATVAAPPALSTGDPDVDAALPALAKSDSDKEDAKKPSLWDKYIGFQESQLAGLSGGVGSLAGGLSYAGRRLEGGTEEEAQQERRDIQNALTYPPHTAEGKQRAAEMSKAASYLGEKPGHIAGESLSSGAQALGLPPEAVGAAGAYGEAVGNLPQFLFGDVGLDAAGRVRPAVQAGTTRLLQGDVATKAQRAVDQAYQSQSMGAAGTAPDVSKASPDLQKALAQRADQGGPINPNVVRRRLRAEQFGINLTEGQATRDKGIYSNEVNSRAESPGLGNALSTQPAQLAAALDNIRAEASPSAVQNNAREHGQTAVNEYKAYDAPIKADITAKYKALADANGGDMPMDGNGYVNAADAALKAQNKARYLPPEIRGTLDDLRDGGNFSFNNFENLRTDLAAASRKADRAGDGNAKAAINIARSTLEDMPTTAATGPLKQLANTARSAAKARFDAIEADPAYEAAVNDDVPQGHHSTLADSFMDKYVVGVPRESLARIQAKFADNPTMQEAIAGHTLNTIRDKANADVDSNSFVQNGYNNQVKKLSDKLDLLLGPERAQTIKDLGETAADVQKYPTGHNINTSNTAVTDAVRRLGEHALQAKTGGFGLPMLRGLMPDHVAKRALAPGAGLDYVEPKPR